MRGRRVIISALLLGVAAIVIAISVLLPIGDLWHERATLRPFIAENFQPYVLTDQQVRSKGSGGSFRECAKDCPEMVVVPAGAFWMGSPEGSGQPRERPRRTVIIANSFAVSRFEVTLNEWAACVRLRGCEQVPRTTGDQNGGRLPVTNVSWGQAIAYVTWLSRMTGKPYRLLSEAEWEYAARGVTSTEAAHPDYPWGNTITRQHANYGAEQCCQGMREGPDRWMNAAPVGQFPSNAFGLHDMHGNVWEWVQDPWHDNYLGDPPIDGSVWLQGGDLSRRVVRGGSWGYPPLALRSASRLAIAADYKSIGLGFRVARSLAGNGQLP